MITGHNFGHINPNTLDDTGGFMAKNGGKRRTEMAIPAGNVRVTNTHTNDPNEHILRSEIGQFYHLDTKGRSGSVDNGGDAIHNWYFGWL